MNTATLYLIIVSKSKSIIKRGAKTPIIEKITRFMKCTLEFEKSSFVITCSFCMLKGYSKKVVLLFYLL